MTMLSLHSNWMQKYREDTLRRKIDDLKGEIVKGVLREGVARLRIAADNLDQQRILIERLGPLDAPPRQR